MSSTKHETEIKTRTNRFTQMKSNVGCRCRVEGRKQGRTYNRTDIIKFYFWSRFCFNINKGLSGFRKGEELFIMLGVGFLVFRSEALENHYTEQGVEGN